MIRHFLAAAILAALPALASAAGAPQATAPPVGATAGQQFAATIDTQAVQRKKTTATKAAIKKKSGQKKWLNPQPEPPKPPQGGNWLNPQPEPPKPPVKY